MKRRLLLTSSVVALAAALAFFSARSPVAEKSAETTQTPAKAVQAPQVPANTHKAPAASLEEISAELAALGKNPDAVHRLQMVEKLAALGPGAENVLAKALGEARTSETRGILADALARIGTSEAVDVLLGMLSANPDPAARADILQALNALPPGQPVETLASSLVLMLDPQVRDGVVATVARAADTSTVQFLHELYHEPEAFHGQAANVLGALGAIHNPAAAPQLAELLRTSGEVPVMQNAAASLGKIGTAESLQPLAESLAALGGTNPELRQYLLAVVQSVSNTAAMDWLQKTASNPQGDPDLAAAAATALKTLNQAPSQ